jgi:excisionase family DNA binding protein
MTDQPLLTVLEAAAMLRIGRNTMYHLIAIGQVPHLRVGRTIRVPRAALERWLEDVTWMPPPIDGEAPDGVHSSYDRGISHAPGRRPWPDTSPNAGIARTGRSS